MTTSISQKIDSYAKAHLKELKQEEAQTGKKLTKYDIAQKMLSSGKLSQSDFASWMGTNEGFQSQQKSKVSIFASQTPFTESYLDTMTDTIEIAGMKYEDTPKNRALKEQSKSNLKKLNKQVKEFTKDTKLTDADKNKTVSEMTREIDAQIENQRFSQMTHDARKKHIVSKFLSAYDQNDKGAMMSALGEFNSYMCQYIDDKLGITDAKQSIKEFVHLDKLVEYIDKNVDDGTDAITFMEGLWEFTKGVGDAVDSFIGAQGLEMGGVLGTASKAIQASGKLAPVLGGAMQAYFGVEGTMLMADGTEKIVNADTKEDVRAGGSEVGMGAIMTGGAVGSVRSGVKGRKVKQEQTQKQTEFSKNAEDVAKSEAKPSNEAVNLTAKETPAEINTPSQAKIVEMYPDKSLMPKAKAKTKINTEQPHTKSQQIKSAPKKLTKREQLLKDAGFSEGVISQMRKESQGTYSAVVDYTLKMVEYMEKKLAKGEKLTPKLVDEAIRACDDSYAQPGYGSAFQEIQKEFLGKYWNKGTQLKEAYHKEGRFLTQSEAKATREANLKRTLDNAGFSEDVISQMRKESQGTYSAVVDYTLKMVEYMENKLAKGEKLTPKLVDEAIRACDDSYAQPGYGSAFQEIQKEFLGKYWNKGEQLKEAYHKEGRFLTQAEAKAVKEAELNGLQN